MNGPHRQRGVALLIALLAVALALVLIGSLLDRGELALARTRNVLRGEQAIAYSEGLEAFAAQVLMRDLDESPGLDTFSDSWAIPLPPQEVPGGTLSARMSDLNGCFNLNNLVSPSTAEATLWRKRLDNLLVALELDPSLAGAIVDWLDADGNIDSEGGAEDSAYLAQAVPYRTANRVFAHVSELRLVRGVSGEVYARLAPEVCALPPGTALNLNTASTAVLMSLDSRMTAGPGPAHPPERTGALDLGRRCPQRSRPAGRRDPEADRAGLGVTSSYFLARGEITLDGIPFSFSSLLERVTGTARGGVHVLERSRGAEDAPNPALARRPEFAGKRDERRRRSSSAGAPTASRGRARFASGRIGSRLLATDAAIVDAVLARKPATVLDIGCGEGWLARALAAQGMDVLGVDAVADWSRRRAARRRALRSAQPRSACRRCARRALRCLRLQFFTARRSVGRPAPGEDAGSAHRWRRAHRADPASADSVTRAAVSRWLARRVVVRHRRRIPGAGAMVLPHPRILGALVRRFGTAHRIAARAAASAVLLRRSR